jgi:hypothetical protein
MNYNTRPRCAVCRDPQHEELEKQYFSGKITETEMAERMNVGQPTVSKHLRGCVPRRMLDAGIKPETTIVHDLNCVNILVEGHHDLREVYAEARANGDLSNSIRAIEADIRLAHEFSVLTGQTQDGPQFNVLMLDPMFISFKKSILSAVKDHPEVKGKISAALRSIDIGSAESGDDGGQYDQYD